MARKKSVVKKVEEVIGGTAKKVEGAIEEIMKKAKNAEKEIVQGVKKSVKEKSEDDKKSRLEELKKKAEKLASSVKEAKEIDLKKEIKPEEKEKKDALVPIDDYLKASIHLGTKVITPDMKTFVYRRRADGLAVFNTALLDDKIRESAEFLSRYSPEEIVVVCKREAGWKAVSLFAEITGIRKFTKKYPSGVLTNPKLFNFIEANLVLICDPWLDKNVLNDAINIGIPVMAVCDTNNYTKGITQILPGNNKSIKSLGIIFYLLTKLYVERRGLKKEIPQISQFIDDWDNLEAPK